MATIVGRQEILDGEDQWCERLCDNLEDSSVLSSHLLHMADPHAWAHVYPALQHQEHAACCSGSGQ